MLYQDINDIFWVFKLMAMKYFIFSTRPGIAVDDALWQVRQCAVTSPVVFLGIFPCFTRM